MTLTSMITTAAVLSAATSQVSATKLRRSLASAGAHRGYQGMHGFNIHAHEVAGAEAVKVRKIVERPDNYKHLENFDWAKDRRVIAPGRSQKSCGSCWAFATAGAVESCVAISNPDDPALMPAGADGLGKLRISEQQLLDCAPNVNNCGGTGGCEGSTQALGLKYLAKHGFDVLGDGKDEDKDKYRASDGQCRVEDDRPGKVTDWVQVQNNHLPSLMYAIKEIGPVTVAVDAGAFSDYSEGILAYEDAGPILDHAVLAVGFGCDKNETKGTEIEYSQCWIKIRNSWGPNWGECRDHTKKGSDCPRNDRGFIRIARQSLKVDSMKADKQCMMNTKPADGLGCIGKDKHQTPPNIKVCGTGGVLYRPVVPRGCSVEGSFDASSNGPSEKAKCVAQSGKYTCTALGCVCESD